MGTATQPDSVQGSEAQEQQTDSGSRFEGQEQSQVWGNVVATQPESVPGSEGQERRQG